ncbi:hypothetical protein [Rhizobium leguminosarum]|uniref:hypothetical protein n=1 Tax=Rhizobium leguminosarum TaxID=384 RepID=UPI001C93D55D|nr:hypothetical protein [Rhizobium leguminosarum]
MRIRVVFYTLRQTETAFEHRVDRHGEPSAGYEEAMFSPSEIRGRMNGKIAILFHS